MLRRGRYDALDVEDEEEDIRVVPPRPSAEKSVYAMDEESGEEETSDEIPCTENNPYAVENNSSPVQRNPYAVESNPYAGLCEEEDEEGPIETFQTSPTSTKMGNNKQKELPRETQNPYEGGDEESSIEGTLTMVKFEKVLSKNKSKIDTIPKKTLKMKPVRSTADEEEDSIDVSTIASSFSPPPSPFVASMASKKIHKRVTCSDEETEGSSEIPSSQTSVLTNFTAPSISTSTTVPKSPPSTPKSGTTQPRLRETKGKEEKKRDPGNSS
eukprot:TRINITY_DN4810_c0_g1_i13.p1 TRINITY_DN4810_c0_g1~~TRINITY_DN4810_c0_g1_i13.p1  ORF type:complete len:270 (-),score=71.43 TRINITY_DN4810_c0_g1_i13:295-1104(-)